MARGYLKENSHFKNEINRPEETGRNYKEMWDELDLLFSKIKK